MDRGQCLSFVGEGGLPSNARLGPSDPNYTITPFQMAVQHYCKSFINNIMK